MRIWVQPEEYEEDLALLLQENGYQLVKLKWIKQKKSTNLRLTIHRQNEGITHRDCQKVTRIVQNFLTEHGFSLEQGIEVSSPGIHRELSHLRELKVFQGRKVLVSYLNGTQLLSETGLLKDANPDQILIMTDVDVKTLASEQIKRIRLLD